MSQFWQGVTAGSLPPTVPTEFDTQNGNATPLANILIINGFDSTENNDNGIITKGGVVGTGTQNEVDIIITNRATGSNSTVGAVSADVITFTAPNIQGIYDLNFYISAWDSADLLGATYDLLGSIKCDGAGGLSTVGSPQRFMDGDSIFNVTQVTATFSGLNIILRATGLAGKTIKWSGLMTYSFGGA